MRGYGAILGVVILTGCNPTGPDSGNSAGRNIDGQGDTCGASELSHLIGAPRADVDAMQFDQPVRIIGPGNTAVTMDFNPQRVNIRVNEDEVIEITCG